MVSGGPLLSSRLDLASDANMARWGRAHVHAVCTQWGVPEPVMDDALLIASELLTNAQRHASVPAGQPGRKPARCALLLWLSQGMLTIGVRDGSTHRPRLHTPGTEQESGRGLLLVACLAQAWGHEIEPGGKVVWARLGTSVPAVDQPPATADAPQAGALTT